MFTKIRATTLDRIMSVRLFYTASAELSAPRASTIAKGLVFVELYAVYEFTVREAFEKGMSLAASHSIPMHRLCNGMRTLALDSEFKSLADLRRRSSWPRRMELLAKAESVDIAKFEQIEFPEDGTHYRHGQLETLWSLLGMNCDTVSDKKHLGRIDEMVEHRNAIAHGRDTADSIGGRFSDSDIKDRIEDVQEICLYILQCIEDHFQESSTFCK
jgi:hypothetical protein